MKSNSRVVAKFYNIVALSLSRSKTVVAWPALVLNHLGLYARVHEHLLRVLADLLHQVVAPLVVVHLVVQETKRYANDRLGRVRHLHVALVPEDRKDI